MTIEEFHNNRKPFYIDLETLLVKFPDARHSNMSHAQWFADFNIPWVHMVRGYYMENIEEPYIMLYWGDFEIPNIVASIFPYLFEHFPKIKWIGLGCNKGKEGEIWPPKLKVIKGDILSK